MNEGRRRYIWHGKLDIGMSSYLGDCLVASEWRKIFDQRTDAVLKKLNQ